jgi:hypothetical protein
MGKIYLVWGGLIFLATKVFPYIAVFLFGVGPALFTIPVALIVTFYAAYKGSMEMLKLAPNKKKANSALNGFLLLIAAQVPGIILDFLILQRFNYSNAFFPMMAAMLGGYWVDRKVKGTKIFGF